VKKSIDQLCAEYANSWKGFRIDGKGHLVLVKAPPDLRLATRAAEFPSPKKAYDDKSKLYISGVANAREVDRMAEVLDPGGLDSKPFLKNPVLLRQHNHDHPIGCVDALRAEHDGVHFDAWVGDPGAAPLTEMQQESRSLIAQRILRAVSVGFIPHKIRMPAYNENGEVVEPAMIEHWEMLELSTVAVPCNAGSLFGLKAAPKPTEVQTLIFDKEKFSKAEAKAWAKDHDFKADKVDETGDSYRLRQADPGEFEDDSFRTVELTSGVKAVVGKRKKAKAIVFPRMGKAGRLEITSSKEAATMDPEVKALLEKLSQSMGDLAKGVNTLIDGQKATNDALVALKGKKPPKDDEEDDDEDMKKTVSRVEALEKSVKEQGETVKGLVDAVESVNKTLEILVTKVA